MKLVLKNEIDNEDVSLIEEVEILKNKKEEHFSKEKFEALVNIISYNKVAKKDYIRKQLIGYKKTIEKYPTISEWRLASKDEKIIVKRNTCSNLLYYHAMILSGRLQPTMKDIKDGYKLLPECLLKSEYDKLIKIINKLGYSKATGYKVLNVIRRIMICKNKKLLSINYEDLQEYKKIMDVGERRKGLLAAVHVLRELEIVNSKEVYYFTKSSSIDEIRTINSSLNQIYIDFQNKIKSICYKDTYYIKERCARYFLEWLEKFYPNLIDTMDIEEKHICKYIDEMKESTKTNGQRKYSNSTINGYLAHLKSGLFQYLKEHNKINDKLDTYIFGSNPKYYELYYAKSKKMYNPISLQDRTDIERAIYSSYNKEETIFIKMLILLYQLGLRPFELLLIKLDCLRGTKEIPQLYVHRCKKFKERYIPLTEECLEIINKLRDTNKESPYIYSDKDGLSCQRLFNFNGSIPSIVALEDNFSNILIKNGIIDNKGNPKYTLYVLRRLRITLWLERGISAEIVAKLVGHDDVDSHNYYIVSKETRIKNCKKVYNEFYHNLLNEDSQETENQIIEKDFIQQLNEELIFIENKTVNRLAFESIIDEFPEYILPVSCGSCMAKAFEEDIECEMMNIPCIECENLKNENIEVSKFDELVGRIFKNIRVQEKKKLDGLIKQSNKKVEKLKLFYVNKLNFSMQDVEKRFKRIEETTIIKRGRKRKEVNI